MVWIHHNWPVPYGLGCIHQPTESDVISFPYVKTSRKKQEKKKKKVSTTT
jgi:hypothetical protein